MELVIENITEKQMKAFKEYLKSTYRNNDETYTIVVYADECEIKHLKFLTSDYGKAPLYRNFVKIKLKHENNSNEYIIETNQFNKMILM